MLNNWKIGRIFGINTYIHWSFWLLPLFVYLSGTGAMAVIDTLVVLAIFGCVALHELGHALAARQYGVRTRDIVLYPIGGVARLERMPKHPMAEIVIALAGPAVNVAIVALLAPLMILDGYSLAPTLHSASALEIFWTKLLYANIGLAMFNMIPAFPMDGGRVLRAGLTWFTGRLQATEIAASIGTGFAIVFGVLGLLSMIRPDAAPGFATPMFLVLAAFLHLVGQTELQQVRMEESRPREPIHDPMFVWPRTWTPDIPVLHPDGWEYDPQSRMWTLWRSGMAVKRVAAP